jgi:hypothetical protein
MIGAFKRMSKGVLAMLGEDSLLRGEPCGKVNIEHGVQVVGTDNDVVIERSVATIDNDFAPKVKDTLTHPDGTYRLDAIYQNNGANPRFILLKL